MTSRILVAMDRFSNLLEALAFARPLASHVAGFKVHSLVDAHGAAQVIQAFREFGGKVMADLKLKDIPATVADRASVYARQQADFLTVHASGGVDMMKAGVGACADSQTRILAISVLTSMTDEEALKIYGAELPGKVLQFARMAAEAGCHGLVCSGKELEFLAGHDELASLKRVVPGIRLADGAAQDQKRVMTPNRAVELGADYLVIGREITKAEDPLAVVHRINEMTAAAG